MSYTFAKLAAGDYTLFIGGNNGTQPGKYVATLGTAPVPGPETRAMLALGLIVVGLRGGRG